MNRLLIFCLLVVNVGISACSPFQPGKTPVIQPENVSKLGLVQMVSGSAMATSLAFHPSDPVFAVGWDDGSTTLRNFAEQKTETLIEPNNDRPTHVLFNSNGNWLVSGNQNGVIVWNYATREIKTVFTQTSYVLSISFDAEGNRLATVGSGKTWVWDVHTGSTQLNCLCNDLFFLFNPGGQGPGISGGYWDLSWHDDTTLQWQSILLNAEP